MKESKNLENDFLEIKHRIIKEKFGIMETDSVSEEDLDGEWNEFNPEILEGGGEKE